MGYDPGLPDGPQGCSNCGMSPEDMAAPEKLARAELLIQAREQLLKHLLASNVELRELLTKTTEAAGQAIRAEAAAVADLEAELEKLQAFARWLIAMDHPAGRENRRAVTLQVIINRAREALREER